MATPLGRAGHQAEGAGLTEPGAIFVPGDGGYLPTELARGPWDPAAQHGGPAAGLVARLVERAEPADMTVARLTLEFLRPVPLEPLVPSLTVLRPGRKVQLLGVSLQAGGLEVVRAVTLRIRAADLDLPEPPGDEPPPLPEPGPPPFRPYGDTLAFHTEAVEIRPVGEPFAVPGVGTAWIRLAVPLLADEQPSALVRVAAVADFGNGISPALHFRRHLYINPDLTIHLHRYPTGEWVCLEARTFVDRRGNGLAESALWDRSGRLGRALQSLFVDERPEGP